MTQTVHQSSISYQPTMNNTGSMFNDIIEAVHYWTSSNSNSSLSLIDLGAAYGVNTLHALKNGRDVISVDADPHHLHILKTKAAVITKNNTDSKTGRLIDTKNVWLPHENLFPPCSTSGALLSELIHFLTPTQTIQMMKDVYQWLEPGALCVTVSISSFHFDHEYFQKRWSVLGDRSVTEIRNLLEAVHNPDSDFTGEQMLRMAPVQLVRTAKYKQDTNTEYEVGDTLYLLSVPELKALAEMIGFIVEKVEYISPRRYRNLPDDLTNETVMLVAKKPIQN